MKYNNAWKILSKIVKKAKTVQYVNHKVSSFLSFDSMALNDILLNFKKKGRKTMQDMQSLQDLRLKSFQFPKLLR